MKPLLWLRYAARELRSGLSGFWIFLICLFLGTASIAITGSLSAAVSARACPNRARPFSVATWNFLSSTAK